MVSLVKYQYRNEEIQIVEGDDFSLDHQYINVTQWQATGEAVYYEPHPIYGDRAFWYAYPPVTEKQGSLEEVLGHYSGHTVSKKWKFGGIPCYRTGYYHDEWWMQGDQLKPPRLINASTKFTLYEYVDRCVYEIRNCGEELRYYCHSPVFTYWHACDGDRETTLEITLDGAVKLHRVDIENPPLFVKLIAGYECPENTCPVLCQDTICCYNSQGISIEQFLKEESIY